MISCCRRFLVAGLIPFFCIFSQTLLQYNAVFALGGMVNHTSEDWDSIDDYVEEMRLRIDGKGSEQDTCVAGRGDNKGHDDIPDGPFFWDSSIEGLINSIVSAGILVGTIMTLFVYDYFNNRLVFATCLAFPGFLNILTPTFAKQGGHHVTVIFRFFTGLYTAILTPVIPALVNRWFLPSELYRMSIGIFLGIEFGRMFFSFTGDIIEKVGWEFLFYFPGGLSILMAIIFYIFMTDDPLENQWISAEEKSLLASVQRRSYTPAPSSTASSSVSTVSSRLKKYKQQMKFKNAQGGEASRPPWSQILGTWMLWVTTLQAMGQAWSGVMMILMVKEYLEEIHGYSLQEAAIMVTIPNNLTQFFLGLCVGYLGDLLIKKKVAARTVRRLGSGIQMLACLPLLLLPFLPCSWIEYRASMVVIQSLASFRVFGNLAGYSSYRDISPTFHRHLFGLSSILSLSVPGVLVPVLMGGFGTTRRDQWQQLFPLNCSVVILTNLLYIALVTTDTAPWEPTRKLRGSKDSILENLAPQDATRRVAETGEVEDRGDE